MGTIILIPSGIGIELAFQEQIGSPMGVVGWDDLVFEAEFDGEFACPGFLGDPGIGAALDDEAILPVRFDNATEARRSFVENEVGVAAPGEFVSGGDSAKTASDDGDARHQLAAATG